MRNNNRVPECDLNSSAINGECGPGDLNFGNPFNTTRVNPDIMSGWGNRPFDWRGAWRCSRILPRTLRWTLRSTAAGGHFYFRTTRRSDPRLRLGHDRRSDLCQSERTAAHDRSAAHVPQAKRQQRVGATSITVRSSRFRDETLLMAGHRLHGQLSMTNGLGCRVASARAPGTGTSATWAALPEWSRLQPPGQRPSGRLQG